METLSFALLLVGIAMVVAWYCRNDSFDLDAPSDGWLAMRDTRAAHGPDRRGRGATPHAPAAQHAARGERR